MIARRVDRVEKLARLGRVEHGRLAAPHDVARPAHGGGRIGRHDLAYHHPIEQVTQRGQAQLRGRRGSRTLQLLDVGRDMHALDRRDLRDALRLKPVEEFRRRARKDLVQIPRPSDDPVMNTRAVVAPSLARHDCSGRPPRPPPCVISRALRWSRA